MGKMSGYTNTVIIYKTVFNKVIKHLQGPCELHLQYLFRKDSIVDGVTFQPLITYQYNEYIRIIPNTYILSWLSMLVINPFLLQCGVSFF